MMIFFVYNEPVSHFVECVFFFFAFRLPLGPVPYLVYLLAGKKKLLSGTFLHDHDEDFRFLFV